MRVYNYNAGNFGKDINFNGGKRNGSKSGWNNNWNNTGKPQCQLCRRFGHEVERCYYKFNPSFVSPTSSSQNSGGPRAYFNRVLYHSSTLFTTLEVFNDNSWYPDSGFSNHVTLNANNLQHNTEFTGQEKVHIGDGSSLLISRIGHFSLISSLTPKVLSLNHMLLVLSITKNLLSVSIFEKDNNVFFEFHYDACFVKDQDSQAVILTGKVKDGLYSFDSSNLCLAHP